MSAVAKAIWIASGVAVWAVGAIFTAGAVDGMNEDEPSWNRFPPTIPVVMWPVAWLVIAVVALVGRPLYRLGASFGRKTKR